MAEDTFKKTIIGLILFVAFAGLLITVAVDFGAEYGRSSDEIGSGSFNASEFRDSTDEVSSSTENYRERFEGGEVDDVDDASGVFSIVTDMINLITAPFRLISQILTNILGVPTFITNILLGILGIILILAIWRLLRAGS